MVPSVDALVKPGDGERDAVRSGFASISLCR
jgi:hypothetical protein